MAQLTSPKPSDLEIMMYLDGELSDADAQVVARWLRDDDVVAGKAQSLGQISDVVRTSIELDADDAECKLAGLWVGIDAAIHANGTHRENSMATDAASVVSLADKRATDALVKQASWFSGWQGHVTTGAFVAAAVAILMYVTRPERVVETQRVVRTAQQSGAQQGASSAGSMIPVVLQSQDPEVEELEVYGGTGSIMTVHADEGEAGNTGSSAVIWISNDTDVVEKPI